MNRENKTQNFEKDRCKTGAGAEDFTCQVCGRLVTPEGAGTRHRNHCPYCLSSKHLDVEPGDRAARCGGTMEPIAVWVRRGGEWAIIHRCRVCGALSSNRVAADDNPFILIPNQKLQFATVFFASSSLEPLNLGLPLVALRRRLGSSSPHTAGRVGAPMRQTA